MSRSKNWMFRVAATFLPILLFIMTPALGIWFSVARDGQVETLIKGTLQNDEVRKNLTSEFSDSLISNLDEKSKSEVQPYIADLKKAVNSRLANPKIQDTLAGFAGTVFDSVTTGKKTASIDPTPIVDDLVTAINSVSGLKKISKSDIGEIKPITVGSAEKPLPDLSPVINILRLIAFLTLFLVLLSGFAIWRLSKTPLRGLALPLLIVGVIWSAIYLVGFNVLRDKLEPGIQSKVFPILAAELLSGLRMIGLVSVTSGVILLVTHFVLQNRKRLEMEPAL